jgi:hypothetical protein
LVIVCSLLAVACEDGAYVAPPGFVTNQRIAYSDGLHNENTDLLALPDRILLVFRGGETGQVGSDLAHINVYASMDGGQTFAKQSEVNTASLPGMRDIRDPKLVAMNGMVYLYAISRLPGGHYRDLAGQAWTVRAESADNGITWTAPVKTFSDVDAAGDETFWGFWRFQRRSYVDSGVPKSTLYALGYDDGDIDVGMFASDDGVSWTKQSLVMSAYDKVPSEAELQFFGDNQQTAVAIVRMDDEGILENGQSAICTSQAPFTNWECGRHIEERLDGPKWIIQTIDGVARSFVVARKHLPCTYKRTAVYELRGDLADPSSPVEVCEIQELTSAGDTAYTSLAPLGGDQFLLSWYSTPVPQTGDIPWLQGTYSPSDIWVANLNLALAPDSCHAPPPKGACEPPPLPSGSRDDAQSGDYLLTIAPVLYPSTPLLFRATTNVHDHAFDLSLQPLDTMTLAPTGAPWVGANIALGSDGRFDATFGDELPVPTAAYPLLDDPFLELCELHLKGVMTEGDSFCGTVEGIAQVLGSSPADQEDLGGSTFGAVAITGSALPPSTGACAKAARQ